MQKNLFEQMCPEKLSTAATNVFTRFYGSMVMVLPTVRQSIEENTCNQDAKQFNYIVKFQKKPSGESLNEQLLGYRRESRSKYQSPMKIPQRSNFNEHATMLLSKVELIASINQIKKPNNELETWRAGLDLANLMTEYINLFVAGFGKHNGKIKHDTNMVTSKYNHKKEYYVFEQRCFIATKQQITFLSIKPLLESGFKRFNVEVNGYSNPRIDNNLTKIDSSYIQSFVVKKQDLPTVTAQLKQKLKILKAQIKLKPNLTQTEKGHALAVLMTRYANLYMQWVNSGSDKEIYKPTMITATCNHNQNNYTIEQKYPATIERCCLHIKSFLESHLKSKLFTKLSKKLSLYSLREEGKFLIEDFDIPMAKLAQITKILNSAIKDLTTNI